LGAGTLGLALLLTVLIAWQRLGPGGATWNAPAREAARLTARLAELGASSAARVMQGNPPGFYLASGLDAVVIPAGSPAALADAARRYHVDWILLDQDHAAGLDALYGAPNAFPDFLLMDTLDDTLIFQLAP
jgi:hypothetical protein